MQEFITAMDEWHRHGLMAFTINLQGGSPEGYSKNQPWHNSALDQTGGLRPKYMRRLEGILDRADELGMDSGYWLVPVLTVIPCRRQTWYSHLISCYFMATVSMIPSGLSIW